VMLASEQAMRAAVEAVDVAFAVIGASAVARTHPVNRCFRDLHTANQHIAFSGEAFKSYARECFATGG
jgi:alkylation response protein AidB-like acyl-CoA dehydrogenase